ncbi:hypothetical protein VIGAN_08142100 [Vigna angularis var. angularis]|uniref:Uncharacterized protein n=1 Tax=Vigna angularis var. angularis TaxID=157739 RepID=A0A0S3SPN3_PHAAN|nr:hypothetical protein VIGAN_08142100 [Vigna angularis var. angularis]
MGFALCLMIRTTNHLAERLEVLPRIVVDSASMDTVGMGGGQFGSFGGTRDRRYGDTGFGRGSGFGRSGGYNNSGFGRSSGGSRFSHPDDFGGFSGSDRSGGFGEFGCLEKMKNLAFQKFILL